ncbi:unnamed protein product, partial [Owenia fusiformis]
METLFYSLLAIALLQTVVIIQGITSSKQNKGDVTSDQNEDAVLAILSNYTNIETKLRPYHGGRAVEIACQIYVAGFGSINEVNMDYSISIFLRQRWHDPRLEFSADLGEYLTLGAQSVSSMWIPAIFFPNEKAASFHDITVPNKVMRIYPNGTVQYSVR